MTTNAQMQLSQTTSFASSLAFNNARMVTVRHYYLRVLTATVVSAFMTQSRIANAESIHAAHARAVLDILLLISLLCITIVALAILIVRDRRYAKSLAYSHQRLELATGSNGIGIWERNLRDDAMFRLFGVDRADYRGQETWLNAIHPDDLARVRDTMNFAIEHKSALSVDYRIILPDSSVRHIRAHAAYIENDRNAPGNLIGTNWDVTEQKQAEHELLHRRATDVELQERLVAMHDVVNELSHAKSAEEFARNAVELARSRLGFDRMGLWFYSEDGKSVRGSFGIDDNGEICDERDQIYVLTDQIDFDMISGRVTVDYNEDVEIVVEDSSVVLGRGQSIRAAIWDGRHGLGFLSFDNLLSGQPISSIQREMARLYGGAIGHLYARRLADDALAESEERFKMAVEAASTGIWAWNTETNALYWSDTVCDIFGVSPGNAPGSYEDYLKLIYEEDRNDLVNAINDTIQNGTKYKITHRIVRPGGTTRWVECYGHISRNANGELARMAGTIVDITERKTMEEALLQSSKLESIGRLAGGIAHDFNNMLAVIIGYAEIVQEQVRSDADLAQCMSNISTTAERAADLTSQLLAFARKQIVVSRVIDLNNVLHEAELILDRLLPSHVILNSCPGAAPVWINADPSQIQQIILNLALNGRDAMPEKGMLTIRICVTPSEEIEIIDHENSLPPGSYATIIVSDTGMGIPAENQSKIFEPFFTTKALGRGTGFGLATVYGIVKQHGGDIAVRSKVGIGSEFKVYLPCVGAPEPKQAVVLATATATSIGGGTVLVAEDQEDLRELISRTLTSSGFNVLAAPNGDEALKIARTYNGEIRLLLTDLIMPGMGGQELAAALSRELPQTKILMMTGYSDTTVEGPAEFLFKPFAPSALIDAVMQQLN